MLKLRRMLSVQGQLQVTETLRWRISPFPGWPASQGAGNVSREGQVDVPCQTPAACPCSELKQLKIEEVNPTVSTQGCV